MLLQKFVELFLRGFQKKLTIPSTQNRIGKILTILVGATLTKIVVLLQPIWQRTSFRNSSVQQELQRQYPLFLQINLEFPSTSLFRRTSKLTEQNIQNFCFSELRQSAIPNSQYSIHKYISRIHLF